MKGPGGETRGPAQGAQPLDDGPRRQNVFATSLALAIAAGGFSVANPFLPLYLQSITHLSPADSIFWAGITQGVHFGSQFISGPFWGYVGDRVGRRPMVIRAQFASATAMLLLAFANNLPTVLGSRLLLGMIGGANVAGMSLVTSTTPKSRMSMALGITQATQLTGIALGPLFGGAR